MKRQLIPTEYGKKRLLSDEFAEDTLDALARNRQAFNNNINELLELVLVCAVATVIKESETDEVSLDEFSEDEIMLFVVTNQEHIAPAVKRVSEMARMRTAAITHVLHHNKGNA